MGLLSTMREVRMRTLLDVVEAVAPQRATWSTLLSDLGQVGEHARPVVIQGGLTSDSYLYEPLRRLLDARGFDVTVTQLAGHGMASLQSDAAGLERMVDAAAKRSLQRGGDGLVDIVAHSKGGLSARWYLQRMSGVDQVSQLITLGTPHNGSLPLGTELTALGARLPGLRSLKQLSGTSAEVTGLNAEFRGFMAEVTARYPGFRVVSIAGDLDRPGLRRTDGIVSLGAAHLDDSLAGVQNILVGGENASHLGIAAQAGANEPALRSLVTLLGERSRFAAHDAVRAVAS
ncbi:MAG: hypothetical protein JWM98_1221 [Thermoleophilia bacterium]|nr:hypothetical protein [Thermoleophilia bacterium]